MYQINKHTLLEVYSACFVGLNQLGIYTNYTSPFWPNESKFRPTKEENINMLLN